MQVDFYLLSKDTVETALPRIAKSVKGAGERMLVVAAEPDHLAMIDRALWEQLAEDFLAHGKAGEAHADRQPVLLSSGCDAENGAKYIALADGTWRMLGEREDVERRFWKQEGGRWVEGP